MQLVIRGHHLPGRTCGVHDDIHVALQVGRDPRGIVPGDADAAEWATEVMITEAGDFRGSAVQGRKGARFIYLTWGSMSDGAFDMFRRAKLMLDDVPVSDKVTVDVHLTDDAGMPRCARLRPPAVRFSSA